MSDEDVKDAIIKYLYQNQGLSGIFDVKFKIVNKFDVKFKIVNKPIKATIGEMDHYEFDGAEITVDLNEK